MWPKSPVRVELRAAVVGRRRRRSRRSPSPARKTWTSSRTANSTMRTRKTWKAPWRTPVSAVSPDALGALVVVVWDIGTSGIEDADRRRHRRAAARVPAAPPFGKDPDGPSAGSPDGRRYSGVLPAAPPMPERRRDAGVGQVQDEARRRRGRGRGSGPSRSRGCRRGRRRRSARPARRRGCRSTTGCRSTGSPLRLQHQHVVAVQVHRVASAVERLTIVVRTRSPSLDHQRRHVAGRSRRRPSTASPAGRPGSGTCGRRRATKSRSNALAASNGVGRGGAVRREVEQRAVAGRARAGSPSPRTSRWSAAEAVHRDRAGRAARRPGRSGPPPARRRSRSSTRRRARRGRCRRPATTRKGAPSTRYRCGALSVLTSRSRTGAGRGTSTCSTRAPASYRLLLTNPSGPPPGVVDDGQVGRRVGRRRVGATTSAPYSPRSTWTDDCWWEWYQNVPACSARNR